MEYYNISEDAARRAKDANSFFEYKAGSATAEYRGMVDEAAEIAERQKARVDPMYHEKIDNLLDQYARRLAEVINKGNEIDARVPSILVAGGSNFPVRKKEKQNAARERNMEEYNSVKDILNRIKSVGMGGVRSDDKNALEKIKARLEAREKLQERMKTVNAYYRKHNTLDGCPVPVGEDARQTIAVHERMGVSAKPYPAWALSNNNAEIHRLKERIAALEKEAARAKESANSDPVEGDGYKLIENTEIGRIQFVFDDKPDEETRAILKEYGFKWAPSQGAWQRMLNDNGRWAAGAVRKKLDGEADKS